MPDRIVDFEERLQEWRQADADLLRADQRFRAAMLHGAQADDAEGLYGEVLNLRARADRIMSELLQDMARLTGRSGR